MMRTALFTFVGMTVLALAVATTAQPAAAAAPINEDYRMGMKAFIGDLDRWADELSKAAEAAAVKPELGCTSEMVELAQIGGWMADDLQGTARLAPASLKEVHNAFTETVRAMGAHAEAACGDAAGAAAAIRAEQVNFDRGLSRIASYVKYGAEGI